MLLSEARIVSEAHEKSVGSQQPRRFRVGNFDPRTAIFRAREAYRERNRAKATADRQSPARAEAMTGSAGGGRTSPPPRWKMLPPNRTTICRLTPVPTARTMQSCSSSPEAGHGPVVPSKPKSRNRRRQSQLPPKPAEGNRVWPPLIATEPKSRGNPRGMARSSPVRGSRIDAEEPADRSRKTTIPRYVILEQGRERDLSELVSN